MIGDRWGVTDAEVDRHYPCDDFVAEPVLRAWRGVSVAAPADQVWPWVSQIRVAPYSYDWVDNLGRRSPRELSELPPAAPGDPFTAAFGGRPAGRILSVEPGVQVTGAIAGAVMSYVVVPVDAETTRLLLKLVMARGRLLAPLVSVGDLVMARKQLLTLARLSAAPPDRG